MGNIDIHKIEDGVLLFDERFSLVEIGAGCDKVLPGISRRLVKGGVLEDVYAVLRSMKLRSAVEVQYTSEEDEIWEIFKKSPSDVVFRSESDQSIRWTMRSLEGGYIAFLSDVSRFSDLLGKAAQRSKMQSISELSGKIGHDVNNILTIIQGNLELLQTILGTEEKAIRWMNAAIDATDRGSDFTEKLLYLGRQRPARRRKVDVAETINRIVVEFRSKISDDISIDVSLAEGLPRLRVDETHFKYSIQGLLENAVESIIKSGRIKIEAVQITALKEFNSDGDVSGDFVRILVSDNGIGMGQRIRERAFEPLFTTKEDKKGRGVGLSLVYGFARQSDGYVTIESELGAGTLVEMTIPVAEERESNIEISNYIAGRKTGGGEKILVIDDDYAVRMIAKDMIESLGYNVTLAIDASDALEILGNDKTFDLIFSDVVMPGGIDGIHLARIVRDRFSSIKILLASGYHDTSRLAGVEEFFFVAKPYNVKVLDLEFQRILAQSA